MLEIQAVIQKDLGGLEELAGKNSVEFSNEEGKVTHPGRNVSLEGKGWSHSALVRPHLQHFIQFCVHTSPQYKRDEDKTEQVQHSTAAMSGSSSSVLEEKEASWGSGSVLPPAMRKGQNHRLWS